MPSIHLLGILAALFLAGDAVGASSIGALSNIVPTQAQHAQADHQRVLEARSWRSPLVTAHRYAGPLLFARPRGGAWYVDVSYDAPRPGQDHLSRGDRVASLVGESYPPPQRPALRSQDQWPVTYLRRPDQKKTEQAQLRNYFLSERERRRLAMRLSLSSEAVGKSQTLYLRLWSTFTAQDEALAVQLMAQGRQEHAATAIVLDLRGGIGRPTEKLTQAVASFAQIIVVTDHMTGGSYGQWLDSLRESKANLELTIVGQAVPLRWDPPQAKPLKDGTWQVWRSAPSPEVIRPDFAVESEHLMYAAGRDPVLDVARNKILTN